MAVKMKIPITRPYFDKEEFETVVKPLESGWLVQGRFVAEFEGLFSGFTGAAHAKAVSNCTTALHLALVALGIGPGHKVVVPSFTFVASANAIEYTGAEPVFCDVDIDTFNIDIARLEELLGRDKAGAIKAIMPVNLFGLCAQLPAIVEMAKARGIAVIEDSACGLGAYIGTRHSGTFGDAGCFSFHPRKAVTTGEGGMLVTGSAALAEKVGMLRDHGASKTDLARHTEKGGSLLPEYNMLGYNYRLTDLQGSVGAAQMKKAAGIIDGRAKIAMQYDEAFKDVEGFRTPFVPTGYRHGYQSYVCLYTRGVDSAGYSKKDIDRLNVDRNAMMAELEDVGIATRQGTHAIHTLGYYRDKYGLKESDYYFSYMADRLSIALPLYAGMSDDEFYYVVEHIKAILRRI